MSIKKSVGFVNKWSCTIFVLGQGAAGTSQVVSHANVFAPCLVTKASKSLGTFLD